jgi:glycine/D-amino acid oxidase-like deaminating enzyme
VIAPVGHDEAGFLDATAVRAVVNSPTYLAGRIETQGSAVLDPARLAWGLAETAERLGVRLFEGTRLDTLRRRGDVLEATAGGAAIRAKKVVVATNVFHNQFRRARWSVVPVYDYVLATEPLTEAQLCSLDWDPSIGVADSGNQFHYYRITPDRRILWGGFDPIYHYGRSIALEHADRRETFETLTKHFADTFPQLRGIRFTHRWSGVIDTSTHFCALFGTAHRGRAAYATGFTGLGVGASRFAADVMLDLVDGRTTERTQLEMVRKKPLPFPPEPFAWIGIQITRWSMAREDATAKRNLWLRVLDRLGLGSTPDPAVPTDSATASGGGIATPADAGRRKWSATTGRSTKNQVPTLSDEQIAHGCGSAHRFGSGGGGPYYRSFETAQTGPMLMAGDAIGCCLARTVAREAAGQSG